MLSKKDLEKIEEIVERAVTKSMTFDVTYEKVKTDEGIPTGTGEIKTEATHLGEWWIRYLPQYEGAYRGLQIQIGKLEKKVKKLEMLTAGVEALSNIILRLEHGIKSIGQLATDIEEEKEFQKKIANRNLRVIGDGHTKSDT